MYLVLMGILTPAIVFAAHKPDPRQYNEPLDVFRGVLEAIALLITFFNCASELIQLIM